MCHPVGESRKNTAESPNRGANSTMPGVPPCGRNALRVSSPFWETGQTKTPATKSRNQINDYNSLGQTCLSCIQLTSHSFKQNPNRSLMRGMTRTQGPLLLVSQHTERRQKGFLGGNLISNEEEGSQKDQVSLLWKKGLSL